MDDDKKRDAKYASRQLALAVRRAALRLEELKAKMELPTAHGPVFTRPTAMASAAQRTKRAGQRSTSKISAAAKDGEGEILLYGTIGEDWWGDGTSAKAFSDILDSLGDVNTIRLRINSGGGDVFDGTAMYNMLVKHDARVTVEIEGVAASAATMIVMAGDEIRISENAHFMIHAASGGVRGNAKEMRQYLQLLDNADHLIRLTYSARTGISDDDLVEMLAFDNWMTAAEALEHGFVDAIDEAKTITPDITPEDSSRKRLTSLTGERLEWAENTIAAFAAGIDAPTSLAISATADLVATNNNNSTGSSSQTSSAKDPEMNKKLRAKCVAAGMSEDLNDEKANEWLEVQANFDKVMTPASVVKDPPVDDTAKGLTADEMMKLWDDREKAKAEKRLQWRKDVDATIELALGDHAPGELAATCYDMQADGADAMHKHVLDAKAEYAKKHDGEVFTVTSSDVQPLDRHIAALKDGLLARCLTNFTASQVDKYLPEKDRAKGWDDFSQMPLLKIAEQCLLADGIADRDIRRMTGPQIAQAALGFHKAAGIRADAAIHTTGSLTTITQDAVNKSLLAGYEESPATWRAVGRQAASVQDFKTIRRISLGAAANLPVWPDNTAPEKAKLSEQEETYAVEARAETLSFSWRLLVNDDLDALSRRPQLLGDAAGRTVNANFWAQVTGNPTMADAQSLFSAVTGNRKRKNLTTGAGSPSVSTVNTLRSLMRLMRGLNDAEGNEGPDVLNLAPAFIVGPAALEGTILQLVMSPSDPAISNSTAFNIAGNLTPVIEPLLDANSSTAWYLFASPGRVDTVEVTFLTGQETPVTVEWRDDETLSQNFSIIQTFAAKAIDHRGLQKHAGA